MARKSSEEKSSLTNEHILWYYNDKNLSESCWIPFGDIENKILEESFLKNLNKVELDNYFIDLERFVQIEKKDSSIERKIQRCIHQSDSTALLRSERFHISPKLVKSLNNNHNSNDNRLINQCQNQFKKMSIEQKLEKAADGILQEGILLNQQIQAQWIAQQLHSVQRKSIDEIEKTLISLYSQESFLYRLINLTLRENDLAKLNTLGPFCQLLFHCDCSSTLNKFGYSGELYRGAQLDDETIQLYENSLGQMKTWDAFSSTSKNKRKALAFGNVLFIINLGKSTRYKYSGMDISSFSEYPQEEEVLIRAARNFLVDNLTQDNQTGKYFIYLSLC